MARSFVAQDTSLHLKNSRAHDALTQTEPITEISRVSIAFFDASFCHSQAHTAYTRDISAKTNS
jgi:hypothetical protein